MTNVWITTKKPMIPLVFPSRERADQQPGDPCSCSKTGRCSVAPEHFTFINPAWLGKYLCLQYRINLVIG